MSKTRQTNLYQEKVDLLINKGYQELLWYDYYRLMFPTNSFQKGETSKCDHIPNALMQFCPAHTHNNNLWTSIVFDDLQLIQDCINEEGIYNGCYNVFISGCSYFGRHRTIKTARRCHALIIDVDNVNKTNLNSLLRLINEKVLPKPTAISVSGNGIHVAYIFETPILLDSKKKELLKNLKFLLINKIWNKKTSQDALIEYQGIVQGYRVVGTKTKQGAKEARLNKNNADKDSTNIETVRAFRIGHRVTIEYLLEGITKLDAIAHFDPNKAKHQTKTVKELLHNEQLTLKSLQQLSCHNLSLKEAKQKYPEWYQRVVVEKKPPSRKNIGRKPYDKWLSLIKKKAKQGTRRKCIMCLAAWAVKCGIPEQEFINDAFALVKPFDALTIDKTNPFKKETVDEIILQYNKEPTRFLRMTIPKMEKMTGIKYPREKYRSKKSSPDKRQQIKAYFSKHPDEKNISKIARECNCSRTTVYKYLNN